MSHPPGKKPAWMTPIQYNDPRFEYDSGSQSDNGVENNDAEDIQELLDRPDRKPVLPKDDHPIDYSKGPHDQEFGVDEPETAALDDEPVDYSKAPHDEEFGEDEFDEFGE